MTYQRTATSFLVAALLCGGCGGDTSVQRIDTGTAAAASTAMTMPAWMRVDSAARTVNLDITAGQTSVANYWNYNGFILGQATITVPVGYTIIINFTNKDPLMGHSLSVMEHQGDMPAAFTDPQPAFAGAVSPDPMDPAKANQPGGTQTITFTADRAGEFKMLCLVPAHAAGGMWVHFNVSAEGKAGLTTSG